MKISGDLLSLSVILTAVALVASDTPANCTYADAQGWWYIGESQRTGNNSITCGGDVKVSSENMVHLQFPNVVVDMKGHIGHWTLIYNQGFEIVLNYRKYFAFFNYTTKSLGNYYRRDTSLCHEIKVGWAHDVLERDWSCFTAHKKEGVQRQLPKSTVRTIRDESLFYKTDLNFIRQINTKQKSWKAKHYPELDFMTLRQVRRRAGGGRAQFTVRAAPATARQRELAASLPAQFDWRNINGQNFVEPVPNQGGCGSCYAFSSTGMIASRLRVVTNNTVRISFSEQDVVECSEYSQGCEGGFPYLIAGKYAEDFGMVEESCNPYKGQDGKCTTKKSCRRYYATNYQYVGGFYGACNEEAMKLALVHGGPVAVAFMVYGDFMHYSGGIYHHTGLTAKKFNPFEITNHAVLLVGWGASSSGEPYWIVRNSWGQGWGEQGYFRIRRGTDECAIESIAVVADPIVN